MKKTAPISQKLLQEAEKGEAVSESSHEPSITGYQNPTKTVEGKQITDQYPP